MIEFIPIQVRCWFLVGGKKMGMVCLLLPIVKIEISLCESYFNLAHFYSHILIGQEIPYNLVYKM